MQHFYAKAAAEAYYSEMHCITLVHALLGIYSDKQRNIPQLPLSFSLKYGIIDEVDMD